MNPKDERREFAQSRPLPPFGAIIKWVVDLLQLADPASYTTTSKELADAQAILGSTTAENVFAGSIVKEDTKERFCAAFAVCVRAIPALPFSPIPVDDLSKAVRNFWTAYEQVSGHLSSIREARARVLRALFRQATVDMAIRAGAVACLCDDSVPVDDVPVWSQDEEFKKHLRKLLAALGSRDEAATQLNWSQSQVDRWVDDLDVPAPAAIRKWEELLTLRPAGQTSTAGQNSLWRLYVGRRLWNSISATIPEDLCLELLRAYCRIKRRVHAHFALDYKLKEAETRQRLVFLAITGRISDPLLAYQTLNGETDVLWRRHLEGVSRINSFPTADVARLCQTWASVSFVFDEVPRERWPLGFDDFVREFFQKAERGGSPSSEYARLLEKAGRHEGHGDLDAAAACIEQLVAHAPIEPAAWYSLGRIRRLQQRPEDAERCYRTTLKLDPRSLDARTDLAVLLTLSQRAAEAREQLDKCDDQQRLHVEWRFAHGLVLLFSEQPEAAKDELLKCAKEGYVPSVCYQFLAIACEMLGEHKEEREYRKRAMELGAAVASRKQS